MRKSVFGRQLSRTKNQRTALFKSLLTAMVEKGEITTTLAKAKAIKAQVEKAVTRAKNATLADRRILHRLFSKNQTVNRLCEVITPLFKTRNGGYTRIVRLGVRKGDNASMAVLAFVEKLPVEAEVVPTSSAKGGLPTTQMLRGTSRGASKDQIEEPKGEVKKVKTVKKKTNDKIN